MRRVGGWMDEPMGGGGRGGWKDGWVGEAARDKARIPLQVLEN